ncbi:PadR family transcriptional regulator [Deinococcus frigens]|uniref:PadR family transcriptional regulator n=1 Tax=Deinococcus frigens TaxID=249403 RepID=UPI000495C18C|nr:PadR family transcriptional regulator [Deinococcus frigens]
MSDASLGPSSYIVLGLIAQCGAATSYDLKRQADESVGYFWNFPRSQLYAEPQRLVGLGLLSEQQEDGGRRRRTYAMTPEGRAALQHWLAAPAGMPELRDPGLLKLFFIDQAGNGALEALAAEQLALHRARLSEYRELEQQHGPGGIGATLKMGHLYERASIAFWLELSEPAT